jgi:hypothetical protein
MKAWPAEPFWQWWHEQMDLSAAVPSPALPAPRDETAVMARVLQAITQPQRAHRPSGGKPHGRGTGRPRR